MLIGGPAHGQPMTLRAPLPSRVDIPVEVDYPATWRYDRFTYHLVYFWPLLAWVYVPLEAAVWLDRPKVAAMLRPFAGQR